ncbi:MAG TPA: hypothetical protein VMR50_07495 [Myxococcota bacterium]|nr:hypothetical protein [Myxococcota bacterium]
MPPRIIVTLALAAWVTGGVCGCGPRASHDPSQRAETQAVGAALGGAVAAEVPTEAESLPADVPIPPGLHTVTVTSEAPGSVVAILTGELEPEEVARVFAEGLRSQGWTIDESHPKGTDLGLFARKDQRIASVVVTRLAGKLHVELGLWTPPP